MTAVLLALFIAASVAAGAGASGEPTLHFERVGSVADGTNYQSALFTPDGSRFICTCPEYAAKVWDSQTLRPLTSPLPQPGIRFYGLAADGKRAFTASRHEVRLWDVSTSKLRWTHKSDEEFDFVSISPDGTRLLTILRNSPTVTVWRAGNEQPVLTLPHARLPGSAIFDPSGKWIATDDGDVRVFAADTGRETGPSVPEDHEFSFGDEPQMMFDSSGRRLLVARDHGFTLVETATGKRVSEVAYDHYAKLAIHVRFSADDRFISVTSTQPQGIANAPARIYEAETGKLRAEVGTDVYDCRVGPGARWALCYSSGSAQELWDVSRGIKLQTLYNIRDFSPDCSLLITGPDPVLPSTWRLKEDAAGH